MSAVHRPLPPARCCQHRPKMMEHSGVEHSTADFTEMDDNGKVSTFQMAMTEVEDLNRHVVDFLAQVKSLQDSLAHQTGGDPGTQGQTHDLV